MSSHHIVVHTSHDASRLIFVFSPWRKEGSRVSRGIFNDPNFKMQLIQGKFRWALWVWPTWPAESTFNGYCLVPSPFPTLLPTGVVNLGSSLASCNKSVFSYTNIKNPLKISSCNMQLCVTQHNYASLPITTYHCPSPPITFHHYTLLPITIHHYPSLHITIHHYP